MNTYWLVLICLVTCCLIMSGVWLWATKIKNAGVVDVFWAFNFPVIALLIFLLGNGMRQHRELICGMVILAGGRLGIHLWNRVIGHLNTEEGRYQQLRKEWAPHADRKFFWFFQFQAISNVLLALPFFLIGQNKAPVFAFSEFIGAGLWLVAVIGEGIADWQLAQFKKNPANNGEVCNTGLWYYSRHPNYFFQAMLWIAYFIFAVSAPSGWISALSPAIIIYLLFKVTGIPATEEQSLRSKGDKYRIYQDTTSVFIPWFKLHKS